MNLQDARRKYLGKAVTHMATGLAYRVVEVETKAEVKRMLEVKTEMKNEVKDKIEGLFEHLTEDTIPFGEPESASIHELETHYRILDEPVC
jgi:hypothetical protein